MTAGVDTSGLTIKTFDDIIADMSSAILGSPAFGPDTDLDPDEPFGAMLAIAANEVAECWELLATAFSAFDEESVEGWLQTKLAALTGTTREPAIASVVTINCTLVNGTILPPTATVAKADDPTNQWLIVGGYTALSTGVLPVKFQSTQVGPVIGPSGTLTNILTPVSGWSAATNPLDATLGAIVESDPNLRIRRRQEIGAQGSRSSAAIRAKLLQIKGVISTRVFQNLTPIADSGTGRPPNSIEISIWDGVSHAADPVAIRALIYDNAPPGIELFGNNSGNVVDQFGDSHYVPFSYALEILITVNPVILVDASIFPVDGVAQVQAAILAAGIAGSDYGSTVIRLRLEAACFSVKGVLDVPSCTLQGNGGPPITGNISVGALDTPVFDTSRINVTVTS